jgi:hypothetical protein
MKLNKSVALLLCTVASIFALPSFYKLTVKSNLPLDPGSSSRLLTASRWSSLPTLPKNVKEKAVEAPQSRQINSALITMITDSTYPLHVRAAALRKVLASGTRTEVLNVLFSLANPERTFDFETTMLCAEFTSPMSTVALDAVVDLLGGLAGKTPPPNALPTELTDGMRKGLQSQNDMDQVGQAMERAWRNASPDLKQGLESLEIPAFYAIRTATLITDEPGEALLWMARLETCAHPRTPDSILALALDPAMSIAELSSVLYNWSQRYSMPETALMLTHAMTDPTRNTVQQGISALGLAGTTEALSHVPAIQKAANETKNAWLQSTMNYAIKLAQENIKL